MTARLSEDVEQLETSYTAGGMPDGGAILEEFGRMNEWIK